MTITITDLATELNTEPELVAGMAHQLAGEDGSEAVFAEMEPAHNISGRPVPHGRLIDIGGLMVDSGRRLTAEAAAEIRANFREWVAGISAQWLNDSVSNADHHFNGEPCRVVGCEVCLTA